MESADMESAETRWNSAETRWNSAETRWNSAETRWNSAETRWNSVVFNVYPKGRDTYKKRHCP